MVDYRRTSPAHHQSTAVHMLHLHFDGSTAAYWEEGGGGGNKEKGREAVRSEKYRRRLTFKMEGWKRKMCESDGEKMEVEEKQGIMDMNRVGEGRIRTIYNNRE